MKTVTKRQLNQQTARVLAEVDAGETIVVTERGIPRWRIERAETAQDPLARLEAQGRLIRAKPNPTPFPPREPGARRYRPSEVDEAFAWTRGDR